jgi:hypothetical protein
MKPRFSIGSRVISDRAGNTYDRHGTTIHNRKVDGYVLVHLDDDPEESLYSIHPSDLYPEPNMSSKKKSSDPKIDQENAEFINGIARGPWANMWGDLQEEKCRSLSGVNLYDAAPATPRWAKEWAKNLAAKIVLLNVDRPRRSTAPYLEGLYQEAKLEGFKGSREAFGFYLGCQSVGMGIAWDDNISTSFKIELPYEEFYKR